MAPIRTTAGLRVIQCCKHLSLAVAELSDENFNDNLELIREEKNMLDIKYGVLMKQLGQVA